MFVKNKSTGKIFKIIGEDGKNKQFYIAEGHFLRIPILLLKSDCEVIENE